MIISIKTNSFGAKKQWGNNCKLARSSNKNSATKNLIVLYKPYKQSISVILGDFRVVNKT